MERIARDERVRGFLQHFPREAGGWSRATQAALLYGIHALRCNHNVQGLSVDALEDIAERALEGLAAATPRFSKPPSGWRAGAASLEDPGEPCGPSDPPPDSDMGGETARVADAAVYMHLLGRSQARAALEVFRRYQSPGGRMSRRDVPAALWMLKAVETPEEGQAGLPPRLPLFSFADFAHVLVQKRLAAAARQQTRRPVPVSAPPSDTSGDDWFRVSPAQAPRRSTPTPPRARRATASSRARQRDRQPKPQQSKPKAKPHPEVRKQVAAERRAARARDAAASTYVPGRERERGKRNAGSDAVRIADRFLEGPFADVEPADREARRPAPAWGEPDADVPDSLAWTIPADPSKEPEPPLRRDGSPPRARPPPPPMPPSSDEEDDEDGPRYDGWLGDFGAPHTRTVRPDDTWDADDDVYAAMGTAPPAEDPGDADEQFGIGRRRGSEFLDL